MPDIVLCLEASHAKGMGHVYRALRLYEVLQYRSFSCAIVINDDSVSKNMLEAKNIAYRLAPLDRYDDISWQRAVVQQYAPKVWIDDRLDTSKAHGALVQSMGVRRISLDDAGEGGQYADALILMMPCCYDVPCPPHRKKYAGLEYLILDPQLKSYYRARRHTEQPRILVSMGGSDTYGATIAVMRELARLGREARVITGVAFAHTAQLQEVLHEYPSLFEHKNSVENLFAEFLAHDILVCGGGMTAFEAVATGLPALIVASEPHEEENAAYLQAQHCALWIGKREGNTIMCDMEQAIDNKVYDTLTINKVDTQGVLRCVSIIGSLL